jgi:hypothetical protein
MWNQIFVGDNMKKKYITPQIKVMKRAIKNKNIDSGSVNYLAGYVDAWTDAHNMRDTEDAAKKVKP